MVSPQNSRRMLYDLIDNEIANAQQKRPSGITLKINNLVDKGLVDRLYTASSVGVNVNLLVRGMCSLIPDLPGISENIRVISIVDASWNTTAYTFLKTVVIRKCFSRPRTG